MILGTVKKVYCRLKKKKARGEPSGRVQSEHDHEQGYVRREGGERGQKRPTKKDGWAKRLA